MLCGGDGDLGAVDLCGWCLATLPFADPVAEGAVSRARATLAPFVYRDPVGSGLRALKFHGDLRPARLFGALLAATVGGAEGITALLPVPLHHQRYAERGFNQAEIIARHAGRWLGVPVRSDWLRRTRATPPQTGLRGAERRRNLVDAFAATDALRPVGRIVLIDDVLTTGATVAAARAALVAAGVPAVQVWTVARGDPRRDTRREPLREDAAAGQPARSA